MSLLRRKPDPDGIARLSFVFGDAEWPDVWPEWDGEEDVFVHLPSVVWDEYLRYVRGDREGEFDLFRRWVNVAAVSQISEFPFWQQASFLDDSPEGGQSVVTIEVHMEYEKQRLRARSSYEPKADTTALFELAPLVVWDWVFGALRNEGADDAIEQLVRNLGYQVEYYDQRGLAVAKELGRAPFHGAMSGARDRLIVERSDPDETGE